MNLSFDHDHAYMGPRQGRPGLPSTTPAAQTTSRLATPNRLTVSHDTTGQFHGVSSSNYQQTTLKTQYQAMQTSSGLVAMQQGHPVPAAGNSLNLSGLLREPTPEPEQKPDPVVLQQEMAVAKQESEDEFAEDGDIDIQIRNVVCNYTLPLHIDLRKYALASGNVTYDRGKGVLLKQKRDPPCYVKIYSSGKVYIVGCKSEGDCMRAARTIGRSVQRAMGKLHETVRIRNYKVCNVLATCKMPFGVKIEELAVKYPAQSQYEPELSVGLVWRSTHPKGTLRIHTTGSITITGAASEADVQQLIMDIWPIVKEFRCSDRHRAEKKARKRKGKSSGAGPSTKKPMQSGAVGNKMYFSDEDDFYDEDDLDELEED